MRRRRWRPICWRRDSRPATCQVLAPAPRKGNLVARLRGTGARKPLLLLAHLDVVEARREDWSVDPFALLERDGYYYGRGTGDDKAMAAIFVANLIRYRREGFVPDRDLIVALTADEEGGTHNGVRWLLANHRPLIDAELALNEGGGGAIKNGAYVSNNIQASEKITQSSDDLRRDSARGRACQQRAAADGHGRRQLPRAARRDAGGRAPDARLDPGQ